MWITTGTLHTCTTVWTHLGSLPLNRLFGIRVSFGETDGLLLARKGWIRKQHPALQTLLQESLEVLIPELDRVLDGAQGCHSLGRHAVSDGSVRQYV